MKIRNGFVSNSSSSSFIVVGKKFYLHNDKYAIHVLNLLGLPQDKIDECINNSHGPNDTNSNSSYFDVYESGFQSIVEENTKGLNVIADCESQVCYVGKTICNISDIYNITTDTVEEIATKLGDTASNIVLHYGEIDN
jgi:hypothetical protein